MFGKYIFYILYGVGSQLSKGQLSSKIEQGNYVTELKLERTTSMPKSVLGLFGG